MTYLCSGILVLWLILAWGTRGYQKSYLQSIDKATHPLWRTYPLLLFIVDKCHLMHLMEPKDQVIKAVTALAVGKDQEQAKKEYILRKCSTILAAFLGLQLMIILINISESGELLHLGVRYLNRTDTDQTVPMEVVITEEGEQRTSTEQIEVEVSSYYGKQQQANAIKQEAEEYLEEIYLGDNEAEDEVISNLNLPTKIPDTTITLTWESEDETVIDSCGEVSNDSITESTQVNLIAHVYEDTYARKYDTTEEAGRITYTVTVIPKDDAEYDQWLSSLEERLKILDSESMDDAVLELPKEEGGKQLSFYSMTESQAPKLMGIGLVFCVMIFFAIDEQAQQKLKKREVQMKLDYPEIINKFTLLLSAGMTITGAWDRIVADYVRLSVEEEGKAAKKRKKREFKFAYEEMKITNQELKIGVSEQQAIDAFGRRTGMVEYLKLSSMLVQNLKKGSKNLSERLELEAIDAFEERKAMAIRLGEEAGTKQLIPMFVMLFLVIIIIMVPAYWSMQI